MNTSPPIKVIVSSTLLALLCLGHTVAQADDGGTLNFSYPTEIVTLPVGAPLCVVKNSIAVNSSRNVGFFITNDRNRNVVCGSSTTDACSSNTEVLNPVLTTSPSTTQTKRYQVRYVNTSGGTPISGSVSSQVVITATFN